MIAANIFGNKDNGYFYFSIPLAIITISIIKLILSTYSYESNTIRKSKKIYWLSITFLAFSFTPLIMAYETIRVGYTPFELSSRKAQLYSAALDVIHEQGGDIGVALTYVSIFIFLASISILGLRKSKIT